MLIEEAGGAYSVVRDFVAPSGRILTAMFGKPPVVNRLGGVFSEGSSE